jgi:hypothetical protein
VGTGFLTQRNSHWILLDGMLDGPQRWYGYSGKENFSAIREIKLLLV